MTGGQVPFWPCRRTGQGCRARAGALTAVGMAADVLTTDAALAGMTIPLPIATVSVPPATTALART